jgi:uncharacterized protein (DUF2267 family)
MSLVADVEQAQIFVQSHHRIPLEKTMAQEPKKTIAPNDSTEVATQRPAVADQHLPFLEKVMVQGNLPDPYDARDITEVVFRVMRDVMTTEAAERVDAELHEEAVDPERTRDRALHMEISDLWEDTNPIVNLLSRIRPPLKGPGLSGIDSDRFLFRVANEAGLPPNNDRDQVVKAVFSATKDELSEERVQEIAEWLPEGQVRQLWNAA